MRKLYPRLIALAAVAVLLGGACAWPLTDAASAIRAAAYAAFLFTALIVFLVALPRWKGLPVQIFVAMVAGVAAGWIAAAVGEQSLIVDYLGIFGTLFILMLKVVIVPLIFVTVLTGVAGVGDVSKLGALGAKTVGYYIMTTAVAVLIGLAVVNVLQPGKGRETLQAPPEDTATSAAAQHEALPTILEVLTDTELISRERAEEYLANAREEWEEDEEPKNLGQQMQDEVLPSIIENPIMAGQNPIVVIFMAILIGAALAALGEKGAPALHVFQALDKVFITIIMWVMLLAPLGVFALMAEVIADLGMGYVFTLAKYTFTVLFGLALHFCVLSFLVCPLLGGVSPLRFLRGMVPAFEVAFSTSSSSATLPVSIRCVTRRVGANENISNFMLPVGATINMDGTALYLSVASLFIAQVYGLGLGIQEQLMVFLTATLASVGTAGIPGASIGLMSIILSSAGIPVEGIGIVIGVDRILDMSRTVVNVTGDSVGAVVVSRSEGELSEPEPDAGV
ncbi:MAG: dicarboxylate/amino acid:cation symporter [Candidatus Hydrogenedentota bacterium]